VEERLRKKRETKKPKAVAQSALNPDLSAEIIKETRSGFYP
jgi:hypothetical protein